MAKALVKVIVYCLAIWFVGYLFGALTDAISISVVATTMVIVGTWWGLYSFQMIKRRNPALDPWTYGVSIVLIVVLFTFGFYSGAR